MKKLLLVLGLGLTFMSCDNHNSNVVVRQPRVVVNPTTSMVGDNLDLQALGELVRSSGNAQDIENQLNSSSSINNLDLDGDGQVDYVRVTEIGDGMTRGFSFQVELPNGQVEEVATINIEQGGDMANMTIQGNPSYYGDHGYYHSSHHVSDMLLMAYLFSNHRPYFSPYHYGSYPRGYHSYRSVPSTSYRTRVTTRTTTTRTSRPSSVSSTTRRSTVAPTAATTRTSTMARPTTSQKSFRKTSPINSRPVTTGFGNRNRSTSATRSSSPRSTSSFGSSSRRSSSFGSSSRRSSSPSRSSSFGSSSRSSFGSSSRSSFGSSSRSSFGSSSRSRRR
jgi:hypothetical protein